MHSLEICKWVLFLCDTWSQGMKTRAVQNIAALMESKRAWHSEKWGFCVRKRMSYARNGTTFFFILFHSIVYTIRFERRINIDPLKANMRTSLSTIQRFTFHGKHQEWQMRRNPSRSHWIRQCKLIRWYIFLYPNSKCFS